MCIGSSGRACSNRPASNACATSWSRGGIDHARQVPLAIVEKAVRLYCGYRMDIVAERELLIEVKAVERLLPIHEAQILTCLRLSGLKAELLINFNTVMLKDGLRRFVL